MCTVLSVSTKIWNKFFSELPSVPHCLQPRADISGQRMMHLWKMTTPNYQAILATYWCHLLYFMTFRPLLSWQSHRFRLLQGIPKFAALFPMWWRHACPFVNIIMTGSSSVLHVVNQGFLWHCDPVNEGQRSFLFC